MDIYKVEDIEANLFKMADHIDLPMTVGEHKELLNDVASLMRLGGQAIKDSKRELEVMTTLNLGAFDKISAKIGKLATLLNVDTADLDEPLMDEDHRTDEKSYETLACYNEFEEYDITEEDVRILVNSKDILQLEGSEGGTEESGEGFDINVAMRTELGTVRFSLNDIVVPSFLSEIQKWDGTSNLLDDFRTYLDEGIITEYTNPPNVDMDSFGDKQHD